MFPLLVEDTYLGHGNLVVNDLEELKIALRLFKDVTDDVCVMSQYPNPEGYGHYWDCACRMVREATGLQF